MVSMAHAGNSCPELSFFQPLVKGNEALGKRLFMRENMQMAQSMRETRAPNYLQNLQTWQI